jgi:hypothetical protein
MKKKNFRSKFISLNTATKFLHKLKEDYMFFAYTPIGFFLPQLNALGYNAAGLAATSITGTQLVNSNLGVEPEQETKVVMGYLYVDLAVTLSPGTRGDDEFRVLIFNEQKPNYRPIIESWLSKKLFSQNLIVPDNQAFIAPLNYYIQEKFQPIFDHTISFQSFTEQTTAIRLVEQTKRIRFIIDLDEMITLWKANHSIYTTCGSNMISMFTFAKLGPTLLPASAGLTYTYTNHLFYKVKSYYKKKIKLF